MGLEMQPHESHIPYLLAFLADFNLYGCDWLDFDLYSSRPQNGNNKLSYSPLEFDLDSGNIVNRRRLFQVSLHSSFTSESVSDAHGARIQSLKTIRVQDDARRREFGMDPYSKSLFSVSDRRPDSHWERSEEFEEKFHQRVTEQAGVSPAPVTQESYSQTMIREQEFADIPSAFELTRVVANGEDDVAVASETFRLSPRKRKDPAALRAHATRTVSFEFSGLTDSDGLAEPAPKKPKPEDSASWGSFSSFDLSQLTPAAQYLAPGSRFMDPKLVVSLTENYNLGPGSAYIASTAPASTVVSEQPGLARRNDPFFGVESDVPARAFTYGGAEYQLRGTDPKSLPQFEFSQTLAVKRDTADQLLRHEIGEIGRFQLASLPPSLDMVQEWYTEEKWSQAAPSNTPFMLPSLGSVGPSDEMSVFLAEVHAMAEEGRTPVSSKDPITAVYWLCSTPGAEDLVTTKRGVVTVGDPEDGTGTEIYEKRMGSTDSVTVIRVESEKALLKAVKQTLLRYDPDIICGYQINSRSWGYIAARYELIFGHKMDLGRINSDSTTERELPFNAVLATRGRHALNLWSILRKEVTLLKYTLEFVVHHLFHETTPYLSFEALKNIWESAGNSGFELVSKYYFDRLAYSLRILENLEIITKYSEQSRIIGIDFFSSLTRGSQYQVEAVLSRLAKRENYVMISPSRHQVGKQNALEYIPLVMEPKSALYTDPVCVLDFRSLYPSIIIAYNLCYSTCLGRAELWRGRNKLGVLNNLELPVGLLSVLENDVYIAPNGVVYTNTKIRKSLLADMLQELLESRFMIKESMKLKRDDARYQRNLNSQQLALKFIANVTYGYTSASFSGRMPCSELADSIVLTGRETLVKAIELIHSTKKWGINAEVVYGDTDSLFVRLPNTTRSQAFKIGQEIADMVTAANPNPVLLELEKVYQPCFLLTKKRYVGNSYDSPTASPFFDAKGTETVRRDGTPIEQKIEKRSLQILFDTLDLSKVKTYLQGQWRNILAGKVSLQDFEFAQEVKLGHYSEQATTAQLPGGAIVSLAKMAKDPGVEPQYRERVPFVVTAGPPGSRIADRCVAPEDILHNPGLIVDAEYYITKNIIPPLERLFNMVGANIRGWYTDMPRTVRFHHHENTDTLRHYLRSQNCVVCLDKSDTRVCASCRATIPRSLYIVSSRSRQQEQQLVSLRRTCASCAGNLAPHCQSLDCRLYYKRENTISELESLEKARTDTLMEIEEIL